MKRPFSYPILLITIGLLVLVVGCSPLDLLEPTPGPTATPVARQDTPTPTDTPTLVPSPTPTAIPPTVTPPPTATATPPPIQTPTSPPPTATFTPPPPTATATPTPVVINDWRGEYYDNLSLQPPPRVVRNDRVVDFSFPAGTSPGPGLPADNWSARWSRTWTFDEGTYRFHLLVDDGARLWVNGRLLIDAWADGPARAFSRDLYLKGQASIQLDYYNRLGEARARLNWERVTQFEGWLGTYYATADLSGLPVLQRGDATINFDWGSGSPRFDLPADNFSVRWTRRASFDQAGAYRFVADSDDGVRLWVDSALVINAWRDGSGSHEGTINLSAGQHDLRVEYYEHLGDAHIQAGWAYLPAPSASPTPTYTPLPPTSTPAPARPKLAVQPEAGPLGQTFTISGTGWPAQAAIGLSLVRPLPKPGEPLPIAKATADETGAFRVQTTVPWNQGWEGLPSAIIVARSADHGLELQAAYRLQPELKAVSFSTFPAPALRQPEPEPLYLALDSQAAWDQWFGSAPPMSDLPIDWQQEIVLAVLMGSQPADLQLGVSSIVQREGTVSVWLTAVLDENSAQDQTELNRLMIRVPRSELSQAGRTWPGGVTFVILDASGQVLAQGSTGKLKIPEAPPLSRERTIEAPTEESTTTLSDAPGPSAGAAAEPLAEAEATEPAPAPTEVVAEAPAEAPVEALEAPAEGEAPPAAPAEPSETGAQPARTLVSWVLIGLGLALVAVVVLGVGGLALYRWSRR